jgi:hypothetical protein
MDSSSAFDTYATRLSAQPLKDILPPMAGKGAGWVEWWIRRAAFTSNVRDFSPRSLIRVKATALLCSLNLVALPAQDEPACICGRGCLVHSQTGR